MMDEGHKLYLEDLAVGQRFTSPSREVDEAGIRRFAGEFDPQRVSFLARIAARAQAQHARRGEGTDPQRSDVLIRSAPRIR